MTATCPARPLKQTPPSDRDLQIFKLAEISRWRHEKIGGDFGLTRRRVSQIITDVRRWLALHPIDDPALTSEVERQRLARNMERMRLEDIIERAVHGLNTAPATLATTRSTDGGAVNRTLREQPPVDVRLLRMYLRSVNALAKLNERPELPEPPKETEPWNHPRIQEVVESWQLKTHSYFLSDSNLAKFAEDLTVAILDCFGRPPSPSDGSAGASHVSPGEAPGEEGAAPSADDVKAKPRETSDDSRDGDYATKDADNSREKTEKGSAKPRYVKPLIMGSLPPDHPANRRTPRIYRRDEACNDTPINQGAPVVQAQIAPSQIGVAITQPQSPAAVKE